MPTPNIVMITCHDLGRHIGCYGVSSVHTENLDALAARGVRFANAYSTSAVCSPGRASLHTGRYPQSNGVMGLIHPPWWWRLDEGEKHTAAYLKELGYETHLIGFNHIDPDPERLGYDHLHSRQNRAAETVHAAARLFMRNPRTDRPFFAKVGFSEVHRPFNRGSDTSKGLQIPGYLQDTADIRDDLAAFQETIRFFDTKVGEILEALETSEAAENTLVIMTSDHGIPYPGAKWTVRKAGIEVPLVMYQPGTMFAGGRVLSNIVSNVDVLPTLLEHLGADTPADLQGNSFLDVLRDESAVPPRREAFAQYTPDMKRDNLSRSIINDRYHLIRYFDQGRTVDYPVDVHPQTFAFHQQRCRTSGTRPFRQLFDIENDPYELADIGDREENSEIVHDLSAKLLAWMQSVDDPLLQGPLRTPYYDRAMDDFRQRSTAGSSSADGG